MSQTRLLSCIRSISFASPSFLSQVCLPTALILGRRGWGVIMTLGPSHCALGGQCGREGGGEVCRKRSQDIHPSSSSSQYPGIRPSEITLPRRGPSAQLSRQVPVTLLPAHVLPSAAFGALPPFSLSVTLLTPADALLYSLCQGPVLSGASALCPRPERQTQLYPFYNMWMCGGHTWLSHHR